MVIWWLPGPGTARELSAAGQPEGKAMLFMFSLFCLLLAAGVATGFRQ